MNTHWRVRTIAGSAGGHSRNATVTLEVETLSDTVEQVRERVAALPELMALASAFESYLALKLEGFRREYPENHCIVQTAVHYQAQTRDAIRLAGGSR